MTTTPELIGSSASASASGVDQTHGWPAEELDGEDCCSDERSTT